jgi:hypothetical protein
MFKIPNDFDLTQLVGNKIISIDRSINTLSFIFDKKLSITCDGPMELKELNGSFLINSSEKWSSIDPIYSVLEKEITSWKVDSPKSFRMFLKDGTAITFFDNSKQYESFHFSPNGWII